MNLHDPVADGMHQMGFPQTDAAVNEKGIVDLRRHFRDRQRGGVGETVRIADDEGIEGIFGIERGIGVFSLGKINRAIGGGDGNFLNRRLRQNGGKRFFRRRSLRDREFDKNRLARDTFQRLTDQGKMTGFHPLLDNLPVGADFKGSVFVGQRCENLNPGFKAGSVDFFFQN